MKAPRRITLLHGGALGDLVLTLRLTAALKKRFPAAQLTLYARVDLSELPGRAEGVDTFRSIETSGMHALFREASEPDSTCAAELSRADMIVSCLGNRDALVSRRLMTITRRPVYAIDTTPRPDGREHITKQWLEALSAAGLALPEDTVPHIALTDDAVRASRDHLTAVAACDDQPIALLHPGSGGIDKCWPLDRFKQLADQLKRSKMQPCFIVGPVELERHGDGLRDDLSPHAPVFYGESLAVAAGHAAAADMYVGNDAGMTHLAAALGTPVVALFGPTDPTIWRPLGTHAKALGGTAARSSSFDGLTTDDVCRCVTAQLQPRPQADC